MSACASVASCPRSRAFMFGAVAPEPSADVLVVRTAQLTPCARPQLASVAVRREFPGVRSHYVLALRRAEEARASREADCRGCGAFTARACSKKLEPWRLSRADNPLCRRGWCFDCASWRDKCWLCASDAREIADDVGSDFWGRISSDTNFGKPEDFGP